MIVKTSPGYVHAVGVRDSIREGLEYLRARIVNVHKGNVPHLDARQGGLSKVLRSLDAALTEFEGAIVLTKEP